MYGMKRNVNYVLQSVKEIFLVWPVLTTLLMILFSVQYHFQSDGTIEELLHLPVKMTMLLQVIMGILIIYFSFEMGIRICANRKAMLQAIGISSVFLTLMGMVWIWVVRAIGMIILHGKIDQNLWIVHQEISNVALVGHYLALMMFGILMMSIYKKLGVVKFLMFIGVTIIGSLGIIDLNPDYMMELMMNGINKVSTGYILAVIGYGISYLLLIKIPIGGYNTPKK